MALNSEMVPSQATVAFFVDADDPDRNSVVTENVFCSVCRHILTDSAILNPTKKKDDKKKVERRPQPWSLAGLARGLDSAQKSLAYHMASRRQKYALGYDKACTMERYQHHQNIQDTGASGDEGCHLCALISHVTLTDKPELAQKQLQFCIYIARIPQGDDADAVRIYVNPFADANGRDRLGGSLTAVQLDAHTAELGQPLRRPHAARTTTVPGNDDGGASTDTPPAALDEATARDLQLARVAKSTASDHTLALARFWLQSCLSGHKVLCASPSPFLEPDFLPTRLVDLGHAPHKIRVVATAGLDARQTEYLALSHCWGGAAVLSLTAATADTLRDAVPMSALPKTFADAARVVLRLGYRYLWIDSLCIQQDSASDWALESRSMDLVYRRSVLTLAALAGRTSHDGLFIRRNPLCYLSCDLAAVTEHPLEIEGRHVRRGIVEVEGGGLGELGSVSYGTNRHGDDGRTGSTLRLRHRAWVFQEDLLSRRTLYFGADGVYWECLESKVDEVHGAGHSGGVCGWCPDQSGTLKVAFHRLEALFRDDAGGTGEPRGDEFGNFHTRWWQILQAYSHLELTQPGDKLVAIHGLVRAIEASSGGKLTSVAGHWRQNLPFDLLWAASRGQMTFGPDRCTRSSEYRAPSWSWAAVDGPVRFIWIFEQLFPSKVAKKGFDFSIQPDAEVLDIALVPKHEGARFNGQLCGGHITLSARTRASTWEKMDRAHLQGFKGQGVCQWIRDDRRETSYTEVRCILLARMHTRRTPVHYQDAGLALVPHPTSPGSWMRVGVFFQDYFESDKTAQFVMFPGHRDSTPREIVRIM